MAKIDDGGPAFPQLGRRDRYNDDLGEWETEIVAAGSGMSLRDYFAGQALVGMLSNVEAMKLGRPISGESMEGWIALAAYEFADAMLRARRAQSPAETSYAQAAGRGERKSPADAQAQHLGEFGKS